MWTQVQLPFSSMIEKQLESHYASTGSTVPWNDLPRQEGKPSGPPFEVQLPEIHWQPTFKESRCFLPSAWPPSFPGSWADLATLCPAVCELRQPVQVRDREVVRKGGRGRGSGGRRRAAGLVAPGQRGCWVSLEPTLSMSVKRPSFQKEYNPTPLQSNFWVTREISNTLSFKSRLSNVFFYRWPSCCRTQSSLYGAAGDKAKMKHQKGTVLYQFWFSSSMS